MNLLNAMQDEALFGRWFEGDSWASWRAFLKALFALPMDAEDLALYHQCTGRTTAPTEQAKEAWLIGRRGGKSFVTALIACFLACFRDYRPHLAPGEIGSIMILASDRRQSRVIMRYVKGLLEGTPLLTQMIEGITAETISLNNRTNIECHTSNYRAVRGYTILAALCDELAYWRADEDSASPDVETISALRPAMSTIPGSMLLCLSSPYSRRGSLWTAYRKHFGKDGGVLVWQAPTRVMNPTVSQSIIDTAFEEDSARASSEYLALFRSDIEGFISREAIDACTIPGRLELPRMPNTAYMAFCDPAGGSGSDSFTLAISHRAGDIVVLDAIREVRPPFSPDHICREFAEVLKSYGLYQVSGDRYAGSWPSERFQAHGIHYVPSERTKSELYLEWLPLINGGRVELLDHPRLLSQLANLERRTARSGKDSVDHGPGSHDDVCNSVCGALTGSRAPVNFTDDMYQFGEYANFSEASLLTQEDYLNGPNIPTIW